MRDPAVAAVAIASLAVGIAANATIFSLVQAVDFPSLIYPQAARIVFLESKSDRLGPLPISAPDAADIAAASHTLELASLTADQSSILRDGGVNRRVNGRRVAASFFDVMKVAPQAGRVLWQSDDDSAIVLSDQLWRSVFGADPAIVGRSIHLDAGLATVIGVMPAKFDQDSDFWTALHSTSATRDDRVFTMFARLARNASLDDATKELEDISQRLAVAEPATNKQWVTYPVLLSRLHGRDSHGAFLMLQAAVGVMLLIACANIANILLARGIRRQHEIAVRVSLGASRRRMIGHLLTESVVLALIGGALGIVLSMWGIGLARAIGGFPLEIDPRLNLFVLGFTAIVSMLTGILCGILPAIRASRIQPDVVLRAGGGRVASASRGRVGASLVAVQVGSAVVLATCGALMVQSLLHRQRVDLGFNPRGVVRADVQLPDDRYRNESEIRSAADRVLERLGRNPDIAAAGIVTWALPTPTGAQRPFTLPADQDAALPSDIRRTVEAVTPRYFDAAGVSLTRGRAFTDEDRAGSPPVAIVNEELVARLWPGKNPLGESLRLGAPDDAAAPVVTVVGVVSSVRRSAMHDVVLARAYVPFAQHPSAHLAFNIRARGNVRAAMQTLPVDVQRVDPVLLVENLGTVEDDLAQYVKPIRMITLLLAAFAATGLLVAALGVFGMMSYAVSERQREMAVRSALGADRRDLVRLILRNGLVITVIGLIPGILAAILAGRALQTFLFGVTSADPMTLALVASGLALVSLVACYRPARLASRVDPMTALRQQ